MSSIHNTLADSVHREAFRLTESALSIGLANIFSNEACRAAAEYMRHQATISDDEAEEAVFVAIARYFDHCAKDNA